jgi:hypothetical protein
MIVDFEQDPDMPLGTGNFKDEAGRIMYLSDPETANRFIKTIPGKSLTSSVAAESTAAAAGALGAAAPVAGPDLRTANNANDTGLPVPTGDVRAPVPGVPAPGVAATQGIDTINQATADLEKAVNGTPITPKAKEIVGKLDALPKKPAPAATSRPAGSGLPVASVSTTTVQGANRANVDRRIAEESAGAAALSAKREELAAKKDERTQKVLDQQLGATQAQIGEEDSEIAAQRKREAHAAELETFKRKELEANDKMLDPERYMKNMSTGKKLGMIILAALNGGFGALNGQKDNGVLAVIDAEIERDIDQQKSEIASGRVRIGNEIDKYVKMGFDAQTAEKMARDRKRGAVAALSELQAKKLGLEGENLENAKFLSEQERFEMARRRGDLLATTEDREQTTVQRAAPAGKNPLESLTQQLTLRKLMTEQGLTFDKDGNLVGTGKPTPAEQERADKQLEAYDTATSHLVQAQVAFDQTLEKAGITRNPDGSLQTPSDIPAKGYFDAPAEWINEKIGNETRGTQLNKSIKLLEEAFGRMQSQGAITAEELANFKGYIDGLTEQNFAANLELMDEMINGVGERHMRRLGPVALAELASRDNRTLPVRSAGVRAVPQNQRIDLPK